MNDVREGRVDFGSGDQRYAAQVIMYCVKTLCDNNPSLFQEMLQDAGFGDIKQRVTEKIFPDPVFKDFGLDFRSKAEAECVRKMRELFGLQATPLPISMPSPPGCPTNPESFVIDFTIPCDVIGEWRTDQQGSPHPIIRNSVVFVGEYFGFDMDKMSTIPQGAVWRDIDGEVATFDHDGETKQMIGGTQMPVGEKYKLKTKWKKMGETFVADATGYSSIYIHKNDTVRQMMGQLDKSGIIYNSKECPVNDPTCSVASHQLLAHYQICKDPTCDVHAVVKAGGIVTATKVAPAEAYIRSCLADLKIRFALTPAMANIGQNFGRKEMYEYYAYLQKLEEKRSEAWATYNQAYVSEGIIGATAKEAMKHYIVATTKIKDMKERYLKMIYNEVNKHTSSANYQWREIGLKNLLASLSQPNPPADTVIREECTRLMSPYTSAPTTTAIAFKKGSWYKKGF